MKTREFKKKSDEQALNKNYEANKRSNEDSKDPDFELKEFNKQFKELGELEKLISEESKYEQMHETEKNAGNKIERRANNSFEGHFIEGMKLDFGDQTNREQIKQELNKNFDLFKSLNQKEKIRHPPEYFLNIFKGIFFRALKPENDELVESENFWNEWVEFPKIIATKNPKISILKKTFKSKKKYENLKLQKETSGYSIGVNLSSAQLKDNQIETGFSKKNENTHANYAKKSRQKLTMSNFYIYEYLSLKINRFTLEIKSEFLKYFTNLMNSFLKTSHKPDDEEFEQALIEFENNTFCIINLGEFDMGGIFEVTAEYESKSDARMSLVEEMIQHKLDISSKFGFFIGPFNLNIQPSFKNENTSNENNQKIKMDIFNETKITKKVTGGGSENLVEFKHNLKRDDSTWTVIAKKIDPLYVADLLEIECNQNKLKEAYKDTFKHEISHKQIGNLVRAMFKNLRKRCSKIESTIPHLKYYFMEKESENYAKEYNEFILNTPEEAENDVEKLINLLINKQEYLKTNPILIRIWQKCLNKRNDEFVTIVMKRVLECVCEEGAQELNIHCKIEKLQKYKRLLKSTLSLWNNNLKNADEKLDFQLQETFKNIKEQERRISENLKKSQTQLKSETFEIRDFDWGSQFTTILGHFLKFISNKKNKKRWFNHVLDKVRIENDSCVFDSNKNILILCLLRFFEFDIDKYEVTGKVLNQTLKDFYKFYRDFLKDKDRTKVFSEKNREQANESILRVINYVLEIREERIKSMIKKKRIQFISHLFENKCLKLTYKQFRFIEENEVDENIIDDKEVCKLLRSFRVKYQDLNSSSKGLTTHDANYNDLNNYSVSDAAKELCNGKTSITYLQAMRLNKIDLQSESFNIKINWKEILTQLLIKNNFDFVDPNSHCFEIIQAIYYLADDNLRRVLARNFHWTRLPLPFIFDNGECLMAPLGALSMKYSDRADVGLRNKKKKEESVRILNPFYHPSLKVYFLQSRPNENGTVEEFANKIYSNCTTFKRHSQNLKLTQSTITTQFLTNYDNEIWGKLSELTMVMMNKRFLSPEERLYEPELTNNEMFSLELANCVILYANHADESVRNMIYKHIDDHNSTSSFPKLLIEILSKGTSNQRNWEGNIQKKQSDWHYLITDTNFKHEFSKIYKFIYDKYNGLEHKFVSLKEILFPENNKVSEGNKSRVRIDCKTGRLKRVFTKIDEFTDLVGREKDEDDFLKLQHKFYRESTTNDRQMINITLQEKTKEKKLHFCFTKQMIQLKQIHHIVNLSDRSIEMQFLSILSQLSDEERLTFLFYLDERLSQRAFHIDDDKSNPPIKAINFFRELEQIYKCLAEYLESLEQEQKEMIDSEEAFPKQKKKVLKYKLYLDLLPNLMANLMKNSYPIEIFNGDQVVVPVKWVKAILEKLHQNLSEEEQQISVISTVGLQSSGKSTFLNSLFNLSFQTGDDRCTRGSTAIMLPLDPNMRGNRHGLKYVIIIDTEGLSSTEILNQLKKNKSDDSEFHMRDNKMILFNAGMSQMCVINSKRDYKSELNDILSLMMYSMMILNDCTINPYMNFAFQMCDSIEVLRQNLKRQVIDDNKETLKQVKKDYKDRYDIADQNLYSLFGLQKDYEINLFPEIKVDNQKEYLTTICDYRKMIFSSEFILNQSRMTTITEFSDQLGKLDNVLVFEDYLFKAKNYTELKKKIDYRQLKLEFKLELEENWIFTKNAENEISKIDNFINDQIKSKYNIRKIEKEQYLDYFYYNEDCLSNEDSFVCVFKSEISDLLKKYSEIKEKDTKQILIDFFEKVKKIFRDSKK